MRPIRASLLLGLAARTLPAQTVDWARVTIGVSIGVHSGLTLWDVANQPIVASNNGGFGNDVYHLHRDIGSGVTLAAQATHFSSPRVGLTAELTYVGIHLNDDCMLVHDGGDPDLATACAYVGSDQKFGQGINPTSGYHDASGVDHSASATLVEAGVMLRPFKPAALQPYIKAMAGFATILQGTVAMQSIYGAHADTTLGIVIYQDYAVVRTRPVFTAAAGLNTSPNSGLQAHVELRETFIAQSVVTGPTTTQNQQPPSNSPLKVIPSVLVGFELVLQRARGKRY